MAEAAKLLATTYSLVITNVPYLARGKQGPTLREIGTRHYLISKGDLATMFVERGFHWTGASGTTAFVVPQNWLFLKTYDKLRRVLLVQRQWRLIVRLGEHAFEDPTAAGAFAAMAILSAEKPSSDWRMAGVDVSALRGQPPILAPEKALLLCDRALPHLVTQESQLTNPDCVITLKTIENGTLLATRASALAGGLTGDSKRFFLCHWELNTLKGYWAPLQMTVATTSEFAGRSGAVQHSGERLHRSPSPFEPLHDCHSRGRSAWGKRGVAVSLIGPLPVSLYTGERFDPNVAVIRPNDAMLPAVWCFCAAPEYAKAVREIDQALKVTNATLVKVPFDSARWKAVADERYPNGLPEPYSDDPTQWIFHGHPYGSVVWDGRRGRTADGSIRTDATVLQVAVARLLGYRWPAERDHEMRLADQQRAWVERCTDLNRFADKDGIVCLPAVRREESGADRLRTLLVAAYGGEWSPATEQQLLRAASLDGRPAESLEDWLRQRFFAEHCRLFEHRPFVWHIWDGLPNGFHALINYHRLAGPSGEGRRTLEALTYSYLNDWIERQRAAQQEETAGADVRLAAALDLRQQLVHILAGEPPLDLFVRWKPLHRQPLGWEPDIDDGVRMNIRPFMRAKLRKGGRSGAGLLRAKPNIHWRKDRGQEPQKLRAKRKGDPPRWIRPKTDFPWFWTCPGTGTEDERTDFMGGSEFDGNRWNDLHYTLAAKRAARERHERDDRSYDSSEGGTTAGGTGKRGKTA